MIEEVIRSQDGPIRRVEIKNTNASEDFPRITDRSVRPVVRLFNEDEQT